LMTAEWSARLAGVTDMQIKRALDRLRDDFPPSLPKFVSLCREGWEQRTEAYKPFERLLPKPPAKPETVKTQLAEMRKAIKRG